MTENYQPIVSKHISECLFDESANRHIIHPSAEYAHFKRHYSRKYKYARLNGWLVDNGDGTTSIPTRHTPGAVIMRKKEIYNAIKRTRKTVGTIPMGTLSFDRFIKRTGHSDEKIQNLTDYFNQVSLEQQKAIFDKIGFQLLAMGTNEYTVNKTVAPETTDTEQPRVVILKVEYLRSPLYFLLKNKSN